LDLSGRFVFGCDVHNAVCVNVERYLNLRVASGSHGDALELEVAQLFVVLSELTLALEYSDTDLGLIIGGS
jgi:hypothetical protein